MPHIDKPELVIALAGPIGTDLHGLAQTLEESLTPYGYTSVVIKISSLIEEWCDEPLKQKLKSAKQDDRIRLLMAAGDALREQSRKGDALVPIMVAAIQTARKNRLSELGLTGPELPAKNTCYILDSLKHPDEVETLRNLYGANFLMISGFSTQAERLKRLAGIISKSYNSTQDATFQESANKLIEKDAKRQGSNIGQSLRETFPLGDFFLRVSGDYQTHLDRFLEIYFGSPYKTPMRDEFFMYEAKAKSYRSADLSRQIGAVIVNETHHVVASGCNEVPIAGGGSYWPDMPVKLDNRDYQEERDFNAVKKVEIIKELLKFLNDNKIMSLQSGVELDDAVNDIVFDTYKATFKDLRVSNLIEFGRVVHAEMNAISAAAQNGVRIGGGTIYSTTYPCHMCARHIIASGILRVVYIEPYPKSMTKDLFGDIVSVDGEPMPSMSTGSIPKANAVSFEPFEGVSPTLYRDLFEASARKNQQGYTLKWSKSGSIPKIAKTSTSHVRLELAVAKPVERLVLVGLGSVSTDEGDGDADNARSDSGANSA